ncbi:hypothetical protein [Rhodopirellula baltica]|uniref:hypothetical protein n=1 Tax=Rhodopirellula baltica TaxID=265606 RepID=UPI0036F3AD5F
MKQSEASNHLTSKLQTCQPFTSPCRTWPAEIRERSSEAKRLRAVFRRTRPTR